MFAFKIAIVYGLILLFFKRVRTVFRATVFFSLFILWAFAYLYSPYWHAFGAFGFPNLRYAAFIFLFLLGLLWAYLSASDLRLSKVKIHPISLFLISILLYIVNFRQLNADIPWRGDEDFHVVVLLRLKEYLTFFFKNTDLYLVQSPIFWIWLLLLLCVLFFHRVFMKRIRHSGNSERSVEASRISIVQRDSGQARMTTQSRMNYILVVSGLLLITLPALILFSDRSFTDQKNIFLLSDLLRYSFIQKWANFFFVIPSLYNDISLYRIVPFLSLIGIASFLFYIFYKQLQSKFLSLLFSLAFSTVPLLLFYSSILYLEMPMVFLMVVSMFNIRTIIKENPDKLKSHYVWYMLLLMSFLKETVIIFLFLLVLMRMGYQLFTKYKTRGIRNLLFSEIKLSFSIFTPIVTYIFLRHLFLSEFGDWTFYANNVLSIGNYIEIAQSLVLQTGMVPVLALLGLFFVVKKERFVVIVISLLCVGLLGFFLGYLPKGYVDDQGQSLLTGYSRWNLYLIPIILFTASIFVIHIVKTRKIYSVFLLMIVFTFNIFLFPFKMDGARLPNWGAPNMDIAEYTYPYDESIRFLSTQKHANNLLLLGQYSPYWGLRYYLDKYNYHPKIHEYHFGSKRFDEKREWQMFDAFFDKPQFLADAILYHSVNGIELDINKLYGKKYKIVKVMQNSLHRIYLLQNSKSILIID